ncbi:hypothetical protein ACXR2U_18955 [Jatrophihabitans sp. YIM 134969]
MTSSERSAETAAGTPVQPDPGADVADVSGADTSVTSGRGHDVGAWSLQSGDASLVSGLVVDDLDDVAQVSAIPSMPGMSFRGAGADWWEVGGTYVERGWLRSSRDPQIGTWNFAGDEVVALFGPSGRDVAGLTDHPEEQETVFLPGSRFTVVRRGDLQGLWVTVVHVHRDGDDTPPSPDVSDEVVRVASVVARARTLPPAPPGRPGRFAGPFGERA